MKVRTTITETVKVQTRPGPIVDAQQFTPDFTPDGLVLDPRFRGAYKLDRPGPTMIVKLGSWILTEEDGTLMALTPRMFHEQYNEVAAEDKPKPAKRKKGAVSVAQMGAVRDNGSPRE